LSLGGILVALLLVAGAKITWERLAGTIASGKIETPAKVGYASDSTNPREGSSVHALDSVLHFARKALDHHVREHRDYCAVLAKRERVGGKLLPLSRMEMKLRYESNSPAKARAELAPRTVSVYLKTVEPKSQSGREVIWRQGINNDKLLAHEGGLLGLMTVELAPLSRLAMVGNRYPITEIGIEQLLFKLIERGERDKAVGPATVRQTENVMVDDVACNLIEVIHEQKELVLGERKMEFEFHVAQIYFDPDRWVPIKYASYSWPKLEGGEPELDEEYTYEKLEFNVGLTDADFDRANPQYRFSK
jgi:hypothetical protein